MFPYRKREQEDHDMNLQLPDSIASFFEVSNGGDASALERYFTENAVVRDENHTHRGHDAIRAWLREAKRKYAYTVEPLDVSQQESTVKVRARVSGNFPGSPVDLNHVFQLTGGRIELLEIG
jgi:ketosteroid isomerase-like protein